MRIVNMTTYLPIECKQNGRYMYVYYLACVCTCQNQVLLQPGQFFLSVADVSGTQFWRCSFMNLCSPKRFVEFMVMQVDIVSEKDRPHRVPVSNKVHGINPFPKKKRILNNLQRWNDPGLAPPPPPPHKFFFYFFFKLF